MKLGVNARNFGPSATPDGLVRWGRFAEDSGFDLLVVSDHVAPTADVTATYPTPFYDPFTALTWLAAHTSTVELGTSVIVVPYRHPAYTARLAATVDRLAGGRLVLGVGVGWSRPEYAALGVPFAARGAITDEYLEVVRAMWSGEVVSYQGRFVSFAGVGTGPRPARAPHPPIWVGGTAPAAIRRAVVHGDAWHPNNAPLDWLRGHGVPALRAAAAEAGRPAPAFSPRMQLRLVPGGAGADRPAGTGSLDQIRADLAALADLGADYVVLDTNPNDPHDDRPLTEDFRILDTVARAWRGR